MAVVECRVGGRFSRCPNPSINTCQYCGRPFCTDHTHYLEGHEAVCSRKACRLKQEDMAAHTVYKRRVTERNRAGLCGVEDCVPHPALECSLCNGHFCDSHVSERYYPFRQGLVTTERPVSVCQWCWDRRKIWRR